MEGYLAKPSAKALAWVSGLEKHPLLADADTSTERARQCRAGLRLLLALQKAETGLTVPLPKFQHADDLLDWYAQHGQHLL